MPFSDLLSLILPPFWVTLKLATLTTFLLLVFATPLAFWLSLPSKHAVLRWAKTLVMALVTLPIILPPTVLGFYLLLAFSPKAGLGLWLQQQGFAPLAFHFSGLVIGSLLYTLPFFIQPVYSQFCSLPPSLYESAVAFGASRWQIFLKIAVPFSRIGIVLGSLISFAHTIGEFGVVLMIGGSIASETKVISIAIYEQVEALNYPVAHVMSAVLLSFAIVISVCVTLLSQSLQRKNT